MKNSMKKVLMAFGVLAAPIAVVELVDGNVAQAADNGWTKDNAGDWVYYKDGKLVTNKWIGNYYVEANGKLAITKWIGDYYVGIDGKYDKTKKPGSGLEGWIRDSNNTWKYYKNNQLVTNKWVGNYYVQADGSIVKDKWIGDFYVGIDGKYDSTKKREGWVKASNGFWYFYEQGGQLAKNKWIGNYYLQADGSMATNKWVDNGKYFVDENGAWVKDVKKGWVKSSNGLWYFYENNGLLAKNKWIGNYYLQADGSMATNKWVDNNKYFVDSEGKWVENKIKENISISTHTINKAQYKLADISQHNGVINFATLKNNIDGVIIRVGYGTDAEDKKWRANVEGAIKNGIPYGFYWYSYALNAAQAKEEVNKFLSLIKGYKPEYPIFIDMEDADYWKQKQGKSHIANTWAGREVIIKTHLEAYQKAGYFGGVYASKSWFDNMSSDLNKYTRWVAHWTGDSTSYKNSDYGVHQYTSSGKVPGITGNVDLNTSWWDYPSIIKKGRFNNW